MLDLAVGRDATILFESLHVCNRQRVENTLKSLPRTGCETSREAWAAPGESALYRRICERVDEEIVTTGMRVPATHIASVFFGWLGSAFWFVTHPSVLSGCLLGLTMCWVGLAIQHSANHGGLTKVPWLDNLLGMMNDIVPGASSLVWRFHHQVSHHTYCNDLALDQDVYSSFPMIRLDRSQPWESYHAYQWIYGPLLFCFLHPSIQVQDLLCLVTGRTYIVKFTGIGNAEVLLALMLKVIHLSWLIVLPIVWNGVYAMIVPLSSALLFGSFALSTVFIVSHNVAKAKFVDDAIKKKDWAQYQIETSSSWGGSIGSFFTGGLNFQIEHHLFPSMPHHLYVRIQVIVREECAKAGVVYNYYPTLLENFVDHIKFLAMLGRPEKND